MSNKLQSLLLLIGGVFQALISILHVAIFWGISSNATISNYVKTSSYIFNAAVLATVLFFTYISLFRRKDLINTELGKITCIFIALFYLQRTFVEVFLRGFMLSSIILGLVIAALYIIPILPVKQKELVESEVK